MAKVLLAIPLPADLEEKVKAACDIVIAPGGYFASRADLESCLPEVAGVITTAFSKFPADLLAQAARLRVISSCSVGLDHIDVAAASRAGIAVCNVPGVQDAAVAEMTIALLMALARNLVAGDRFVKSGEWMNRKTGLSTDIAGKQLGLIGLGGIGKATARLGQALGLEVVYYKRTRDHDAETAGLARYVDRDTLLSTSDFVSLHLPLTADSQGSIGVRELSLMKPTSFLINTARGGIVDEHALAAALTEDRLAGAALDVMVEEPLPATSPLCGLPNIILQPHAASATSGTRRRMEEACVANLLAVLNRETPKGVVNPGGGMTDRG